MPDRLRKIVFSVPAITLAGLFALYLAGGFLAVPALVKWQAEKQVREQLGHALSVGEVRFNPFTFRLEVGELALTSSEGRPMLAFKRARVDFELRSVIDRAWTFAQASLEAPALDFELDKDGRHNFAALLERLRDPEKKKDDALPRFVVKRFALADGRIEYTDGLLAKPLVARIEPLSIEIDDFSSLPGKLARYRASARSAAGEAFEAGGELTLNPIASRGKLTLNGLEVQTLARALSRRVALDSATGKINFAASFDLAVGAGGALSGAAGDIDLGLASVSVTAAGGVSPLAALETVTLRQGRIDLDQREVAFAGARLAKGSVAAVVDAEGGVDWARLVRAPAASPRKAAAPAAPPPAPAGSKADPQAPWRVAVASAKVSDIAVSFSDPAGGRSVNVAAAGLDAALTGEFGRATTRMDLAKPRLSMAGVRLERGPERLGVPVGLIEAGRMAILAANGRFELTLEAPVVNAPEGLSAKQGDASLALRSVSVQSARATLGGADAAITGAIEEPKIAMAGASIGAPAQEAQLRDFAFAGTRVTLRSGTGGLNLDVEKPGSTLAGLQMKRGTDAVELGSASIAGEKLTLAQASGPARIAGSAARMSVSGLAARQGADRIAVQEALFEARAVSVSTGGAAGVDARIEDAALRLTAAGLVAQGAAADLGRVGSARFGAKSLALASPGGAVDVTGEGLTAALTDTVVRSPAGATELLRLGSATLSGGVLRLKDRVFTMAQFTLANGMAKTGLDAQGRFNWASAFGTDAAPKVETAKAAARADAKASQAPPARWRVASKAAQLDAITIGFEDARKSPVMASAVALEAIRARVAGLDTGSTAPVQVELEARVSGGGEVRASGNVRTDTGASDLKVRVAGLALAPAQTYLSEFAHLRLASGTASAEGRLRYGDAAGAGAKFAYEGSIAIDRVLLEETEARRPFLAWDAVSSGDVVFTLEPNRLDIGELRIDRPSGRLIIAADQTVNLTDVLKSKQREAAVAAGAREGAKPAARQGEPRKDPFPVTIARTRVADGVLEFADLSLRPQFGARMHELKGVITGLGTDPNRSAKLQLDARVDKFGSAKIGGQVSVLEPERFTDINMAFRNLDMPSLSPYFAKFAGYRVASGRLALDLQYRVENRKLLGENKIVLRQLELGEKIDSPHALDLPLELAIAILRDSEGVIDIELPVRGDLNDPQFDYGAVISKALGSLIGGIITAPFRALAALFGAGEKKLDAIDFEPGHDTIAPPERQKLDTLARALKERPALTLIVPPTYAVEEDTSALKSLAVRTDIVRQMGVKLASGEDPGPIDAANPRVQRAIEAVFSQRYAPEVLPLLKRRAIEAEAPAADPAALAKDPAQPPAATGTAVTSGPPPAKPRPGPPPEFYQTLVARLIDEVQVSEPMLAQLAARRGEGIVRELTTAGGVPGARIVLGELRKATDATDKAVALRLELEAAK